MASKRASQRTGRTTSQKTRGSARKRRGKPASSHSTKSAGEARSRRRAGARKWSSRVTASSNALDLERNVFTWKDPRRIAASLKRSAERSKRRKTTPFQSAMSMLTFYINRAGESLGADQRRVLERAKHELRREFGRE